MHDSFAIRGAAILAVLAGVAAVPRAQEPTSISVRDGVFTAEQADRGEVLYDDQCAVCHGAIRQFVPEMAALLGDHTFRNAWRGRSLGELFGYILETMPQDAPGTLTLGDGRDRGSHPARQHGSSG